MKLRIINLFLVALMAITVSAQTDFALTGAITLNGVTLNSQIKKANEKKSKIIAMQALINANLSKLNEYEDKTLRYLSKVQGAINNLYDIKRCYDLSNKILKNMDNCRQAAVNHPKGAVISTLISKSFSQVYTESAALVGTITGLVTKGGEQNLLTSAERVHILNDVTYRLSNINRQLSRLRYDITIYRWTDVLLHASPLAYNQLIGADYAFKCTRRNIDDLIRSF